MGRWVPARYLQLAIVVLTILAGVAATAYAGISGSKHDMSGKGWGTNEICIFCHTPHNANKTVADSPLWNHQVTTATYILYGSPTLDPLFQPVQPRGPSKLCLSCHDGTVAIDSFGNVSGTQTMTGLANLGTDLSNDHPISIRWSHRAGTGGDCLACHQMHGSPELKPNLPLKDGYIECISCHDVHNKFSYAHMTRYTMDKSVLCLKCHAK